MHPAEQPTIEPTAARATDQVRAAAPLDSTRNPFASGAPGSRLGRPVQTAFGELVRLIGLRTRVAVVLGKPGTGKTVLVSMVARACADLGLSVRRIERGDLLAEAAGDKSDVLFVDEADSMSNDVLQSFLSGSDKHADRTMVFMCLPSCISRFSFSGTEAAVVELSPLSLLDSRLYLTERGDSIGRPNVFTPDALDLVIDASRGVPRLLRSIAGLAYFNAAAEGASQIDATHAEAAARMRNGLGPLPSVAPQALSVASEPAEINDRPELAAADAGANFVEASAEPAASAAADEPQTQLHTDVFYPAEAARDRRALPSNKKMLALAIVLLIASAGNFALMRGHTIRNVEPEKASGAPAIAVLRPVEAEAPAPRPSSEGATPNAAAPADSASTVEPAPTRSASPAESALTRSTAAAEAAPTQIAPTSEPTSAVTASRPAATKTETDDPNLCALAALSRDPRALPIAGRCPGAQRALPRNAALASPAPPAMPRAAEVYFPTTPKSVAPAIDAAAVVQSTPAVPVRTTESTQAQAPSPIEVSRPPAALRPDNPAVAPDKVQTQDLGEIARAAQGAAEPKADVPRESDHTPIIIFGYRLW